MLIVSFGYYYASRMLDSRKPSGNDEAKIARDDANPPGPPPIS
jgi:hypothetical protein